jgi:hypothetical protein
MKDTISNRLGPDKTVAVHLLSITVILLLRIFWMRIITREGAGIAAAPVDILIIAIAFLVFGCEHGVSGMIRLYSKKRRYRNAKDYADRIMLICLGTGIAAGGMIIILSLAFAKQLFYMQITFLSFIAAAGAIILLSATGAVRGILAEFGFGFADIICDLIFCVCAFCFSISLGGTLFRYGLKINALLQRTDLAAGYGALGAVTGITIAAAVTLAAALIMSRISRRKRDEIIRGGEQRYLGSGQSIRNQILIYGLMYALPFIMQVIDERIYISMASATGVKGNLIDNWGIYCAGVLPFIGILVCLFIIPFLKGTYELSAAISHKDRHEAIRQLSDGSRFLMSGVFQAAIYSAVLSELILRAIYRTPTDSAVSVVRFAAGLIIVCPPAFLTSVVLLRLRKFRAVFLNIVC